MAGMTEITEDALRELIKDFETAWNRGDLEGAFKVFAEDAAWVSLNKYTRSKEEFLEQIRRQYRNPETMGNLSLTVIEFRIASGEHPTMATSILRWYTK